MTGTPPAGARSMLGDRLTGGVAAGAHPTGGAGPRLGARLTGGAAAVADQRWDVVVDPGDGPPDAARDAVGVLSDPTSRYVYVSSRSVYRQPLPARPCGVGRSCYKSL